MVLSASMWQIVRFVKRTQGMPKYSYPPGYLVFNGADGISYLLGVLTQTIRVLVWYMVFLIHNRDCSTQVLYSILLYKCRVSDMCKLYT